MPWNLPNLLILIRIALTPIIIILLLSESIDYNVLYALGLFIIAALTDAADGWMARRYDLVTTFGKLADPIADKLLVLGTLFTFVWLGEIAAIWVWIILAREVGIMILRAVAVKHGVVIAADLSGKLKTATHFALLLALFVLMQWDLGQLGETAKGLFIFAAVGATIYSGLEYLYKSRSIFRRAS